MQLHHLPRHVATYSPIFSHLQLQLYPNGWPGLVVPRCILGMEQRGLAALLSGRFYGSR